MYKKIALWFLLVCLTVAIFLFPTHLTFSMQPAQSTYIFQSLPLFAIIFIVWVITLVWLFILNKSDWLRMALVGVFFIVFLGFWILITPYGLLMDYQPSGITYVKELLSRRVISNTYWDNFGYLGFPFTPYLGAVVSKITTLSIFNMRTLILLISSVVLGVSLFVFFRNMLKNSSVAFVGALFVIVGNMELGNSLRFYPAGIGLVLFAVFLVLVIKKGVIFESKWDKIIAIVLMLAITTAHYITAFYAVAILLGILAVQLFTKEKLIKWWFIFVLVIIPLCWGLLVAHGFLVNNVWGNTVQSAQQIISSSAGSSTVVSNPAINGSTIATPSPFSFWWIKDMALSYLGAQNPLWIRMIISFWVIVVFIFGSILALVNIFRIKKLSRNLKILTGAMFGIFGLSILAVLASLNEGGYQFFRFLQFGGFFLVPIILASTLKLRKGLAIGLVLLVVLSFPTFLAYNTTIEANAISPQEIQAGQYLESVYGNGNGLVVYTDDITAGVLLYYLPNAYYVTNSVLSCVSKNDLVPSINHLFTQFNSNADDKVFVLSPKLEWDYIHNLNVSAEDPEWGRLGANFVDDVKIYDNGFVQIYQGGGK